MYRNYEIASLKLEENRWEIEIRTESYGDKLHTIDLPNSGLRSAADAVPVSGLR